MTENLTPSCEEVGVHLISELDVGEAKCLFCDYVDPEGRRGSIKIDGNSK